MKELLVEIERAALAAGQEIERLRQLGCGHRFKSDSSPVSEADHAAEEIILRQLKAFSGIPIISEEAAGEGTGHCDSERFFLVDPLDGTKEYIGGSPDFTVNVALIENGQPVAGVVVAPARNEMFSGSEGSAWRTRNCFAESPARAAISVRSANGDLAAAVSASHMTEATRDFVEAMGIAQCRSIGSSLKFCLIAAGEIDLYPRFGRTMQWDTAAADAVLRNAGGSTVAVDGKPMNYGPCSADPSSLSNPHFVAFGDAQLQERVLRYLSEHAAAV
jgi:3'(2'), 5'-bisphosphate nucleotidase